MNDSINLRVAQTRWSRSGQAWAAALIVVAGGLAWLAWPTTPMPAPTHVPADAARPLAVPNHAELEASHAGTKASWPDTAKPAFMAASEWDLLVAALANDGARDAELARIVAYRGFQHQLDQWRHMQPEGDARQRQALARQLLDRIPQHLASREISGAEALVLIDELAAGSPHASQADQARQAALQQLALAHARMTEADQTAQASEQRKLADYKQREAMILRQWLAQTAAQRDQADLERQLLTARQAAFGP